MYEEAYKAHPIFNWCYLFSSNACAFIYDSKKTKQHHNFQSQLEIVIRAI
jgi:hypothetical protein